MSLAQLKKVEIYGLREEKNRLLKEIQELGLVEVIEFDNDLTQNLEFSERGESPERNGIIDRKLAEIGRALNLLERFAPVKPSLAQQFAGVKTYLSDSDFKRLTANEERLNQIVDDLLKIDQDLTQVQAKKAQSEMVLETFKPWRKLDLTAEELKGSFSAQVLLGAIEGSVEPLRQALGELNKPVYLEIIDEDQLNSLILLIFELGAWDEVLAILNAQGVNQVTLPSFEGTVENKVNQIEQDLMRLSKTEDLLKERAVALNQERSLLQVFYDSLLSERERLAVTERLMVGERSFAVKGWIAADKLPLLEERLSGTSLKYVLRAEDPEEGEPTPVILKNNHLITPFEYLVQSFSYPQSSEVDPTPAIAPFFFIFFGIALGDAGYGLFLAIFCAGLLLMLKMGPIGRKLSWMFLLSGVAAIGFGLITGSVLSLPVDFGVFNPLDNPILLLIIALALGFVQLNFGIIISAWESIKSGHWQDAIWEQGFWFLFLNSVLLVLGKDSFGLSEYSAIFNYLFTISIAGLVVGNMRGKKGIIKKILAIPGGLFKMYGGIGFYSDVLSYSRLMALGLSSGVMGGIMNQLAGLVIQSVPVLGWIIGGVIFLFGHALNLSLGVLGAYVHSSRLQYLEFFGKFYEGGGKPLTPLKNEHKYTFVINEREAN